MPTRPPSRCPDCKVLQAGAGRCPSCRSQQRAAEDRRRGSARQRGYDSLHDRQAKVAKAVAVAERRPCPRCGVPMVPGDDLDFGHTVPRSVDPTSRADRVEHSACNRSAKDKP